MFPITPLLPPKRHSNATAMGWHYKLRVTAPRQRDGISYCHGCPIRRSAHSWAVAGRVEPSTGRHFRRMELLAFMQRMLGKDRPVSGVGSVSPAEGSLEANPAKPSVRVSGTESEYSR